MHTDGCANCAKRPTRSLFSTACLLRCQETEQDGSALSPCCYYCCVLHRRVEREPHPWVHSYGFLHECEGFCRLIVNRGCLEFRRLLLVGGASPAGILASGKGCVCLIEAGVASLVSHRKKAVDGEAVQSNNSSTCNRKTIQLRAWCPALKMQAGEGVGQAQVEAHLAAAAPDVPVKLFPNQETQICRKSTQLPVDGRPKSSVFYQKAICV